MDHVIPKLPRCLERLLPLAVACLASIVGVTRADEPAAAPAPPAFRSVTGVPDLYVLSVAYGDPRLVREFVARGDKVDAPGPNGFTPLMAAALTADVEMLHALFEAGADVHAKHSSGASVLDLAQVADWRVVHQLLTHDAGQVLNGTVSLLHTAGLPGRRQDAIRLLKARGAAPGGGTATLVKDLPVLAEARANIQPPVADQTDAPKKEALTLAVLDAKRRALTWLASAQNPEGSWGKYDRLGTSSLVTLACLYTAGPSDAAVRRSLRWWVDGETGDGDALWEGCRTEVCTQAAVMFNVTDTPLYWPQESSCLKMLLARQHADGGFGYSFDMANWNFWDTAWAIAALKTAYWRLRAYDADAVPAVVQALRNSVPFVLQTAVADGTYRYSTVAQDSNMSIVAFRLCRLLGLNGNDPTDRAVGDALRRGAMPVFDWARAPERILTLHFEYWARFLAGRDASRGFWELVLYPLVQGQCTDGSINPLRTYPPALCSPDDRVKATALMILGAYDGRYLPDFGPFPWLQPSGTPQPHSEYEKSTRPLTGPDVDLGNP